MDSEDYTSDEGKRKRLGRSEEELFQKSKRIPRTPPESGDNVLTKIAQMMKLMQDLAADVKHIRAEQRAQGEDTKILKEEVQKMREEQAEYRKDIHELREINVIKTKEINELRNEVNRNMERINKLESEKRKRNIVVQGITTDSVDGNDLKQKMEGFLENEVGVKVSINMARKLGERTCLVELSSDENKMIVMQNKSKLKNRLDRKIFIDDDLTKEERDIQKKIRQRAKEEKSSGKKAKIGFLKLIVDGEMWKWNKQNGKLEKTEKSMSKN